MAELMCPGCKKAVTAERPYCPNCFLTPVPRPEEPAEVTAFVDTAGGCPDPDCSHRGSPPVTGCRACGVGGRGGTALRFDWGEVTVAADRPLIVGRENSPISDRIAGYSNISRRHAEIRSDGTSLTVLDLNSMNGTFVNDERLAPDTPAPVRPGDRVRFAAKLEARVTGEKS